MRQRNGPAIRTHFTQERTTFKFAAFHRGKLHAVCRQSREPARPAFSAAPLSCVAPAGRANAGAMAKVHSSPSGTMPARNLATCSAVNGRANKALSSAKARNRCRM